MRDPKEAYPAPGDIVLLRIKGIAGAAVWLMQAINRDLSRWTHVAVMLDDDTVFEAQPGGAVITPMFRYSERPFAIVRRYQDHRNPRILRELSEVLTDHKRREIVREARRLEGVGYNWGTYVYLALYRFGIRPKWIKRRVQRDERMICSQAADHIYNQANLFLFADGRMPYDVTPGDLARLL